MAQHGRMVLAMAAVSKFKKLLVLLLLPAALLLLALYIQLPTILERTTELLLQKSSIALNSGGIRGLSFRAQTTSNAGISGIHWNLSEIFFVMRNPLNLRDTVNVHILAENTEMRFLPWDFKTLKIDVSNATIYPGWNLSSQLGKTSLQVDQLRLKVPVDIFNLEPAVVMVTNSLRDFYVNKPLQLDLELQGVLSTNINSRPARLGIFVANAPDGKRLAIKVEDLRALVSNDKDSYTQEELDVLSLNPIHAITLLELKERAVNEANILQPQFPRLTTDRIRHVLWSYLITKACGADLARQITTAHEFNAGQPVGNDTDYDLASNEMGIAYALKGLAEDQVIPQLAQDSFKSAGSKS